MAPIDATICVGQKPETMTPRQRITRIRGVRLRREHAYASQPIRIRQRTRANPRLRFYSIALPLVALPERYPYIPVAAFRFIQPCSPIRAKEAPSDGWVHEVKFDGYRVQVVYSRSGHDFTERSHSIAQLLLEAAVLDGEDVATDADGSRNFAQLHVRWTRPGTLSSGRSTCSLSTVRIGALSLS